MCYVSMPLRCLLAACALTAFGATAGCRRAEPLPDLQTEIARLQGESLDDQYLALSNLQTLGPAAAEAVPQLRDLLKGTKDNTLRGEIARTLGTMGTAAGDAAPDLIPLLDSKEMWPRYAAARALGTMGKAALPALPKLITLTKDPDRDVAAVARESARRLGKLRKQK
jgi:HEAT repeat protein